MLSMHGARLWALALACVCVSVVGVCAVSVAGDYEQYRDKPFNVSWDSRTFTINGARKLIISGAIHYPRSMPGMWPGLMKLARENGLNTIESYVMWNLHEPIKRQYDFVTSEKNLPYFLQCAKDAGLFVMLRIGPYICGEWNYGGIPIWTRKMGMTIRTNDAQWESEMQTFMQKLATVIANYLPAKGGPVIITQVENEYGNVEGSYGGGGSQYVQWCAKMALGLGMNTAWIMCNQGDAPSTVVQAINEFYPDAKVAAHIQNHTPALVTELYPAWFQAWGDAVPHRPSEDLAFAVARFVQRGGTGINYYMYHGGTNFGRSVGNFGNFVTSYDYDGLINEYGVPAEPKYRHLGALHKLLARFESDVVSIDPPASSSAGTNIEATRYGNLLFLANTNANSAQTATYNGFSQSVPAWSVLLVDLSNAAAPQPLFCTAQIAAKPPAPTPVERLIHPDSVAFLPDVIGGDPQSKTVTRTGPAEQTAVTDDTTDYLWNVVPIHPTAAGTYSLSMGRAKNYVYVFVDGELKFSGMGWNGARSVNIAVSSAGTKSLQILTISMGLNNYGAFIDNDMQGVGTPVKFGSEDLSSATWTHVNGTLGELKRWFLPCARASWKPLSSQTTKAPMTWYRLNFVVDQILANATYTLRLPPMGKGEGYVNGHHFGHYWDKVAGGNCGACDYRGTYGDGKCRTGCGQPSQSLYHVPREWLVEGDNTVALFEETNSADLSPNDVVLREYQQ